MAKQDPEKKPRPDDTPNGPPGRGDPRRSKLRPPEDVAGSERHRRRDADGETRSRYLISARKIRAADRDVSGPVLRGPHAGYSDIMLSNDDDAVELGSVVTFSAWLTDDEAAAFAEASNVRAVDADGTVPATYVTLPAPETLAWMNASLAQQGSLNGAGVKIAVMDGGTTAAVRAQCSWSVFAERVFTPGANPVEGVHGCAVTPVAVPPAGQLIECMIATAGGGAGADWSSMAAAIVWASDLGAKVCSISFGGFGAQYYPPQAVKDSCAYARDRKVQIVISAGNESSAGLASPSILTREYPNVHAIGAIDRGTGALASFSNYDLDVSGVAPGVNEPSLGPDGSFIGFTGTSCSAPLAAGLIALLCTGGTYNPQQVADALRATARDLGLGAAVQGRGAWSLSHAKAQLALTPGGKVFRASRSSNQIINNSTDTRLAFDTVESSDSAVTPNAAKDVFTLNQAGDYEVTVGFRWGGGASAPGDREVHIGPNIPWGSPGGKMWAPWSEKGSTSPLMDTISTTIKVAAGQQIAAWVWQNCGGQWTMEFAAAHPDNRLLNIAIRYLGT